MVINIMIEMITIPDRNNENKDTDFCNTDDDNANTIVYKY